MPVRVWASLIREGDCDLFADHYDRLGQTDVLAPVFIENSDLVRIARRTRAIPVPWSQWAEVLTRQPASPVCSTALRRTRSDVST